MLVGADIERLRQMASAFGERAETLDGAVTVLEASLGSVLWSGGDAEAFRAAWGEVLRPYLADAAAALRTAQDTANANADAQEVASALEDTPESGARLASVGVRAGTDIGGRAMAAVFPTAPGDPDVRDDKTDYLGKQMQQLRDSIPTGESPAQVSRWWAGLSATEQRDLLRAWPVDLYKLDGIPAKVKRDLEGTGPYNRMEMVDYSINEWESDKPLNEGDRREGYVDIFNVNCANFVSHAMEAGGMEHGPSWGYSGERPWCEPGRSLFGQDAWARDTNVTSSWSNANDQRNLWVSNGHEPIPRSQALPGDVLYFDFERDGDFDHAVVVRAVDPDGKIYYAGHTTSKRTGVAQDVKGNFEKFRPDRGVLPSPSPGPAPSPPAR